MYAIDFCIHFSFAQKKVVRVYESVKTIQDIRDEHIDVLRDFGVKVTSQIVRIIETKTTEIAIENYCRILIIKRLEQEE